MQNVIPYRHTMNIPGEGVVVGESIGGGGWCFGDWLGSLWGGSVAN